MIHTLPHYIHTLCTHPQTPYTPKQYTSHTLHNSKQDTPHTRITYTPMIYKTPHSITFKLDKPTPAYTPALHTLLKFIHSLLSKMSIFIVKIHSLILFQCYETFLRLIFKHCDLGLVTLWDDENCLSLT